ncbi:hypothetical protein GYO_2081 [Bacillus spizizenii TU-B-10]|uniref:Uncharacterized protein n=1 Tax=Bacillus spizizenii (strain DSM 15029 / JCM 12233 / NBRC 101239 / NRRL B-23049 / TU-B-10) TaxID=1052585 RepID=G4NVF4_BACS4|nr:hypothetical protein GYO_2081 [Bacillus spizizenii TU-B-10]
MALFHFLHPFSIILSHYYGKSKHKAGSSAERIAGFMVLSIGQERNFLR